MLVVAAVAAGKDASEVGAHSLRIGGATAMYHSTDDLNKVRRFGRWASDVFHIYLWESHEPMRGVSKNMAEDASSLTKPKRQWKRMEMPSVMPAHGEARGGCRTESRLGNRAAVPAQPGQGGKEVRKAGGL